MPDLNQIKQGEQGHGTAVDGRPRRGVGQCGWAKDGLAQEGDACRGGIAGW